MQPPSSRSRDVTAPAEHALVSARATGVGRGPQGRYRRPRRGRGRSPHHRGAGNRARVEPRPCRPAAGARPSRDLEAQCHARRSAHARRVLCRSRCATSVALRCRRPRPTSRRRKPRSSGSRQFQRFQTVRAPFTGTYRGAAGGTRRQGVGRPDPAGQLPFPHCAARPAARRDRRAAVVGAQDQGEGQKARA